MASSSGIWYWADHFSSCPVHHQLSLGEGNTPLVRSRHIGPSVGLERLFFKLEGVNPTGSYKDRFAAAAVSDMAARSATRCIATSSGNTGAALAAYCATAGIACEIVVVETAPIDKLRQMLVYGAKLYRIRGFGIDPRTSRRVLTAIRNLSDQPKTDLQISAFAYNPTGMNGVQTIAFEIHRQLPEGIDHVFIPAGGGGLTLAVARGFETLRKRGGGATPHIECAQPVGNDTIATPLRLGLQSARDVTCTSRISGLQVSRVIDGNETIMACRATGGTGHVVSDEDVWQMQNRLARQEGIFCEPAGAVSVTAAIQATSRGEVSASATACCLITGVGFKDLPSVDRMISYDIPPLLELGTFSELSKRT